MNFFLLSQELSKVLKELGMTPGNTKDYRASPKLDSRLDNLQHDSVLYEVARALLLERRSRNLTMPNPDNGKRDPPTRVAQNGAETLTGNTDDLVEVTSLESLLFNYQHTIKELLSMRSYSRVTLQELERFKQEFRTAAFTCRLWSCPRAAVGFDSDDLRLAHEASHRSILCDVPDCQYPPFPSDNNLKAHHAKCHSRKVPSLKRTTITKVPASNPNSMQNGPERDRSMMAKQGVSMQTDPILRDTNPQQRPLRRSIPSITEILYQTNQGAWIDPSRDGPGGPTTPPFPND